MNPDRDVPQGDNASQEVEPQSQVEESSSQAMTEQSSVDSSSAAEMAAPHASEKPVVDAFSESQLDSPSFGDTSSAPGAWEGASDPSLGETSVSDSPPDNLAIADGEMAVESDASQPSVPEGPSYRQAFDRGNESAVISRGIHRTGANGPSELVQMDDTRVQPALAARPQSSADVPAGNPRLRRTADGGPPLARPIVLVSLRTDELHAVVAAALKLAIDRDTKTLNQIAEAKVNLAFWKYKAEQRVLNRW